ncbi:hypothetical protein P2G88_00615 [Aliiglaciecola sp. CAU 1673]|uniref:tetratricopeptide repeat protein n=1 Tax=Aliiglaciecola sp. CAU 1673 TaxID=3032595 RepID=UPI0023DB3DDD|nr:tetratricopeptide repeat protein [Aliiglaciecola sp. CAU 1673]MDF2176750.1 hypothetical protein [Aliiglaciecola sp. CAU 1673]
MKPIFVFVLGSLLLFSGCAANINSTHVEPHDGLHDYVFPDYENVPIESEDEVFAISREMKSFVNRLIAREDDPEKRIRLLAKSIFDHSDMNLLYSGAANTIASETFEIGAANCLSMSIMTYALASYAGMDVAFQEVDIPEFWTRRDGFSMLNGHINLRIVPRDERDRLFVSRSGLEVDFNPLERRTEFPTKVISKRRVLSMFYNNKGADALMGGEFDRAYAYFRQALITEPSLSEAWVNLGILYRFNNLFEWAEDSYEIAISLTNDRSAQENLAILYTYIGRDEEAQTILARLERSRIKNPYYHFLLGEQEYDYGHWRKAIGHYKDALSLDESVHQFYFGLAKSYFHLGKLDATERYLEKAKRLSVNDQDEGRYQIKLDLLSKI